MKEFLWKRVNSWHTCKWGPFTLNVDPPDEHSREYVWGTIIRSGVLECGHAASLKEAKQKAQNFTVSFVRELQELDIT